MCDMFTVSTVSTVSVRPYVYSYCLYVLFTSKTQPHCTMAGREALWGGVSKSRALPVGTCCASRACVQGGTDTAAGVWWCYWWCCGVGVTCGVGDIGVTCGVGGIGGVTGGVTGGVVVLVVLLVVLWCWCYLWCCGVGGIGVTCVTGGVGGIGGIGVTCGVVVLVVWCYWWCCGVGVTCGVGGVGGVGDVGVTCGIGGIIVVLVQHCQYLMAIFNISSITFITYTYNDIYIYFYYQRYSFHYL